MEIEILLEDLLKLKYSENPKLNDWLKILKDAEVTYVSDLSNLIPSDWEEMRKKFPPGVSGYLNSLRPLTLHDPGDFFLLLWFLLPTHLSPLSSRPFSFRFSLQTRMFFHSRILFENSSTRVFIREFFLGA